MIFCCKNCGSKKYWKLAANQYRCRVCRKDHGPYLIPSIRLTSKEWKKLIDLFLIGANSPTLKDQLKKSMAVIGKALRLLRLCMASDIPKVFSGTVEVDETYLGGQWKNKRRNEKKRQLVSKRGRGTTKQPVLGILARNGQVWAEVVPNVEAPDLVPLITKQVRKGTKICSDTWRAYTGLAAKGYVHRQVEHGEGEFVKGSNHINGLEGFWGFLKRKLASKGGVRKHYLPLFLGEYVWRYNHRKESLKQRRDRLLMLLCTKIGAIY